MAPRQTALLSLRAKPRRLAVLLNERVEQIQQWLEEETFRSRCVDEETNEWLAHVEISTSCGMVLDLCRNLDEYPVCDGDTMTVILVPEWDNPSVLAAESATARDS